MAQMLLILWFCIVAVLIAGLILGFILGQSKAIKYYAETQLNSTKALENIIEEHTAHLSTMEALKSLRAEVSELKTYDECGPTKVYIMSPDGCKQKILTIIDTYIKEEMIK